MVDAGNMMYTAKTFSEERYSLWNVRAAWHNLPMIGEHEQCPGPAFAARDVRCAPDGMALNIEGAYDAAAGVKRLRRTFLLTPAGLRLTDEGELDTAREVTWVFLLRNRPEEKDGVITAGKLRIRYPAGLTFTAEEKPVTDARMRRNWPGSLWRVKLKSGAVDRFDARFEFRGEGGHRAEPRRL